MRILGIETSCDDTSIAILEIDESVQPNTFRVLSHITSTQTIHEQYGGVFPMMAKREHARNILPLIQKTLEKLGGSKNSSRAKILDLKNLLEKEPELIEPLSAFLSETSIPEIDALAVTIGPGLEPALWVGVNVAKVLSEAWDIPLVPVNHMEGHLLSPLLGNQSTERTSLLYLNFPSLALLISGGHTELVLIKSFGDYEVIGKTLDDAVGEAFDKVARLLDLPYPGGPEISKLAEDFRLSAIHHPLSTISFPRPMIHTPDYNFSFSGLKTAVRYFIRDNGNISEEMKKAIACEFEDAACEVLIKKTTKAIEEFGIQTLLIGGGVASNIHLQNELAKLAEQKGVTLYLPEKSVTTDNALMITLAGYFRFIANNRKSANLSEVRANGNLSL